MPNWARRRQVPPPLNRNFWPMWSSPGTGLYSTRSNRSSSRRTGPAGAPRSALRPVPACCGTAHLCRLPPPARDGGTGSPRPGTASVDRETVGSGSGQNPAQHGPDTPGSRQCQPPADAGDHRSGTEAGTARRRTCGTPPGACRVCRSRSGVPPRPCTRTTASWPAGRRPLGRRPIR
jgi:hypothetical protein